MQTVIVTVNQQGDKTALQIDDKIIATISKDSFNKGVIAALSGLSVTAITNEFNIRRNNMYLGFILWAIILVVILWNISPALVITSALIGVVLAIGKTKDNKSGE